MPYKTIEERRAHYQKHKDEINAKRREKNKTPEFKEKRREENRRWRENNRELANERSNISKKKYEAKCKKLALEHYGNKCLCCGENNESLLTMDHMNGGGTQHRKRIGNKIYVWLYKNNFPEGFQTLCFNCNWLKYYDIESFYKRYGKSKTLIDI